jgi:hypothetical protein
MILLNLTLYPLRTAKNPIRNKGGKATFPEIQKNIDMNGPRFNEVLYGRDGKNKQQRYGLLSKCDSLVLINDKKPYALELSKDFKISNKLNIVLK